MAVEVGKEAPDFTLRDQNREEVTLSSYRGQKSVLLVFFPFAFSGICTSELCQVRDELPSFEDDDVQVIGISVDHPFALKSWAAQEGYLFPLVSDFWPHGEVAKQYGVFNEIAGMAKAPASFPARVSSKRRRTIRAWGFRSRAVRPPSRLARSSSVKYGGR